MPTDPTPSVESRPADAAPHARVTRTRRRRLLPAAHWSSTAASLPVWLRAVVTGFVAAFVTIFFRWLVQAVEWLATSRS